MKKYFLIGMGLLFLTSAACAEEAADIEGLVHEINYVKSMVAVRNELANKMGNRDYRIQVKQGMINNYKPNDRLKIWLDEDHKEAAMIELVHR